MRPSVVKFAVFAALLAPMALLAKTSDRQQAMDIQSDKFNGNSSDGKGVYSQNVVVTQGTLIIHADTATVISRDGEPSQATFIGKQVTLRQQQDDGTWMDGVADRIDYDAQNDVLTFTGNYTITSPKGSSSGQHMTYDTKTGNVQAGGDGSRVHTVLKPRAAQGTATVGQPQQVPSTTPQGTTPAPTTPDKP